jgi:hypothetical protein
MGWNKKKILRVNPIESNKKNNKIKVKNRV